MGDLADRSDAEEMKTTVSQSSQSVKHSLIHSLILVRQSVNNNSCRRCMCMCVEVRLSRTGGNSFLYAGSTHAKPQYAAAPLPCVRCWNPFPSPTADRIGRAQLRRR